MSTYWSLYVVPDNWTHKDCMMMGYMMACTHMMRDDEFKEFHNEKRKKEDSLYNELLTQPAIHDYTSDDGGDPDHKSIMKSVRIFGRLYRFDDKVYEMVPQLKEFVEKYKGKRYICMN
jgi:hypothetical protein